MGWLEDFGIMLLLVLTILVVGYGILRGIDIIAYLSGGGSLKNQEAFSRYMAKRRREDARLLGVSMKDKRFFIEVNPYDYRLLDQEEGEREAEAQEVLKFWDRFDELYFRFPSDILYVNHNYAIGLIKPIFQRDGGEEMRERIFFVWYKVHTDLHFTIGDLVDALEGKPIDFYGENNDT